MKYQEPPDETQRRRPLKIAAGIVIAAIFLTVAGALVFATGVSDRDEGDEAHVESTDLGIDDALDGDGDDEVANTANEAPPVPPEHLMSTGVDEAELQELMAGGEEGTLEELSNDPGVTLPAHGPMVTIWPCGTTGYTPAIWAYPQNFDGTPGFEPRFVITGGFNPYTGQNTSGGYYEFPGGVQWLYFRPVVGWADIYGRWQYAWGELLAAKGMMNVNTESFNWWIWRNGGWIQGKSIGADPSLGGQISGPQFSYGGTNPRPMTFLQNHPNIGSYHVWGFYEWSPIYRPDTNQMVYAGYQHWDYQGVKNCTNGY